MTVESSRRGDKVAVVRVSGRMDAVSSPEFDSACEQTLREGASYLVLDLADLQYVSSMGLRSFLLIAKQAKGKGGDVLLCGIKGLVKELFDMTHITPLFRLFDTVDEAAGSL